MSPLQKPWVAGRPSITRLVWIGELLCAGLALLGGLAVFRLLHRPPPGALWELCTNGAVGYAAGWWVLTRTKRAIPGVIALLVVLVVAGESATPVRWHHVIANPATWHHLMTSLTSSGGRAFFSACVVVALAGAASRLALGRLGPADARPLPPTSATTDQRQPQARSWSHPALALLPALGLATWSATSAPGVGAGLIAGAVAGLGGALLVVGDIRTDETSRLAATGQHPPVTASRRAGPVTIVAVALVALIGSTALAAGVNSKGPAEGATQGATNIPTTEALATDVVTFADQHPDVVLFRVRSTFQTYWQVAVLTRQVGDTWQASPALVKALATPFRGTPAGSTTSKAAVQQPSALLARVTIAAYSGRALPVPVGTQSVVGPPGTRTVDAAVLQSAPATPGQRYVAAASVTGLYGLAPAAEEPTKSDLAGALTVQSAPAQVRALARRVVAGSTDADEMVQRLVNWFRSDRFHYTTGTQPPPTRGASPVVTFLTSTRTGNCESFTDAFTLMARSLGIPTRVAIGFTGGSRSPDGTTTVVGADAHTWPEVDLGTGSGWVSVEPTPASVVSAGIPVGVLGPGAVGTPTAAGVPPAPTSRPAPTHANVPTPAQPGSTVTSPRVDATRHPPSTRRGRVPWFLLALSLAIALPLVAWLVFSIRRRRRAGTGSAVPPLDIWQRCQHALGRIDLACPANRSPIAHVRMLMRAELMLRRGGDPSVSRSADHADLHELLTDLELVALFDRAERYGSRPPSDVSRDRAATASVRVELRLRHQRLRPAAGCLGTVITSWAQENGGTSAQLRASYRCGPDDAEGVLLGADRSGV